MKHVFKHLDFTEDRGHAESVATKELKLDYTGKFTIRNLANDIKEHGCVESVQSGGFGELAQTYEAEDDGTEPPNCGIESRKVAIATPFCVMREPDFQYLGMVYEIVRIVGNLEAPVDASLDC